jgi:hypothetical protein
VQAKKGMQQSIGVSVSIVSAFMIGKPIHGKMESVQSAMHHVVMKAGAMEHVLPVVKPADTVGIPVPEYVTPVEQSANTSGIPRTEYATHVVNNVVIIRGNTNTKAIIGKRINIYAILVNILKFKITSLVQMAIVLSVDFSPRHHGKSLSLGVESDKEV